MCCTLTRIGIGQNLQQSSLVLVDKIMFRIQSAQIILLEDSTTYTLQSWKYWCCCFLSSCVKLPSCIHFMVCSWWNILVLQKDTTDSHNARLALYTYVYSIPGTLIGPFAVAGSHLSSHAILFTLFKVQLCSNKDIGYDKFINDAYEEHPKVGVKLNIFCLTPLCW